MKLMFPKNLRLIFKAKKFSLREPCASLRGEISLVITEFWSTLAMKLIYFWDSSLSYLQFYFCCMKSTGICLTLPACLGLVWFGFGLFCEAL